MSRSARIAGTAAAALLVITGCAWGAAWRADRGGTLSVSFLDVGQGDAIFVESPSGRQMLVDGGPNASVLRRLSERMPWWDRSLDVIVATHPDADHIGGLIDVLDRYDVALVVRSGVEGKTQAASVFDAADAAEGARDVIARRGQTIDLGGGAYAQILFPDRPVEDAGTNEGCTVLRVVFGATSFMLPCDAPQGVENYLAALDGASLRSDLLKAGHHGSKSSSGPLFLGFVHPDYGVFSRGCGNRYGHPAPETVARFAQSGIKTADTCTEGTVTFRSDGRRVWRE